MAERSVKKSSDGGTGVSARVDESDIRRFVNNLKYLKNQIDRTQAILGLGKICSTSSYYRDLVLASGALAPLLAVSDNMRGEVTVQRNLADTLSELCKGTHTAQFDVARTLLVLGDLANYSDEFILYYTCRAFNHLFEEENNEQKNRIHAMVDDVICNRLVNLTSHKSDRVAIAALKAVRCLADERFIKNYCEKLQSDDSVLVLSCLKILRGILQKGEELKALGNDEANPYVQIWINPYAKKIQDYQGFDRIQFLSGRHGLICSDEVIAEATKIKSEYIRQ